VDRRTGSLQLRENWRARATEQGLGRSELDAITGRDIQSARVFHPETEALLVAREVTENASTFDRRDVLQAWAALRGQGAQVADLEHLTDGLLTGPAVVRVSGDGHDARFTTPELLALERELLDDASQRRDDGVALVARAEVERVVEARGILSDEQAALVHGLTGEGSGVQVVRAPAGTGKTFALEAAREAWEQAGYRVFGAALSARAASELQSQAGIDSTTIARLRGDLDRGHGLRDGDVLVVDEAGMVGTRDLHALSRHAAETAAKLVLVGDDRQLPEIAAGGAFRAIASRQAALELTEVRRQRHTWDREALQALRDGEIEHWANAYREHGRIVARPTAHSVRSQLVSDWWTATQDPEVDAVMIAHRRADVSELNDRARTIARAAGQLGTDEVIAGDRAFSTGDRIVCERNDRRTDLVNGARGQVTEVDPERSTLTLLLDDGREVHPSDDYLDDGHLAHGYALTAHKAQGATVDRAFVLGSDELYREWGYTALSRHRDEARFYLVSPGSTERNLPNPEPQPDPITERLVSMLGASRIQRLATDQIEPATPADDKERKTLVASMLKLDLEKRDAAQETDYVQRRSTATRERLERNTGAREELGLFARRERADLAKLINRDNDDLTRDQAEIEALNATHDTAIERQLTWLAEHGDRTAALLIAEQHRTAGQSAIQTDELRSSLADRSDNDGGLLERDGLASRHLRAIGLDRARSRGPAENLAIPRGDAGLDLGV
jgi:Ti-type conjugative transfer relaxase TraA